ncbi:uncharacterized protein LOC125662088 [Ostrea edulis]|uniref:uncharacterized protein LOC125662088 n=1 Tax=Ostrea edulis TaxID=37623 RepID=UPI0024AF0B0B|nr:uncharacterized protein LOC125662088 [Ostrea edulis]
MAVKVLYISVSLAKEENIDFSVQSDLTPVSHEVGSSSDVGFSTANEDNLHSVAPSKLTSVKHEMTSSTDTRFSGGPCSTECKGHVSCYLEHNCTNYKHCYALNAAECHCAMRTCSFGTFWNPKINTCDRAPNVLCKYDPCLTLTPGTTYPSNFNCRTYYVCSKGNRSLPKCCEEGNGFLKSQGCTRSTSCKVECVEQRRLVTTATTFTKAPKYRCYFRDIIGRNDKYYNVIANVEQDCPPGTVFKPVLCRCTKDSAHNHQRCTPMVNVSFTGERIINLSHESYIQVENVTRGKSEKSNTWFGIFNGKSSSIQIPRFSAVALPRLTIKMSFFSENSTGSRYQILVSNCRSSANPWNIPEVVSVQTPSVAIVVDTVDKELTFLGYSDDDTAMSAVFTLPFKVNSWNAVKLIYNGSWLYGRVRSLDQNSTEVKGQKPLSGRLAPSQGPVRVGRCSNGDAFRGKIRRIEIYDCITL